MFLLYLSGLPPVAGVAAVVGVVRVVAQPRLHCQRAVVQLVHACACAGNSEFELRRQDSMALVRIGITNIGDSSRSKKY